MTTKRRQSRSKPDGKTSKPRIDITPHMSWAEGIARKVSRKYRFGVGSQEEMEIISAAYLVMAEKSHTYEPKLEVTATECGALFRGYCTVAITTDCRREARRLLNGGTYNTRNETPGITLTVDQIPSLTEERYGWEPIDYRSSVDLLSAAH